MYFWDGNTSTQITNSGQVMSLSMAPDGSYITYQENNEVKAYEIATNSTYTLNTNSTNILDIGNNLFDTGECVFYKKIIPKEREIIPRGSRGYRYARRNHNPKFIK
ncbi:MAG: hypothetical protein KatS3mg068_0430 [Candidatus Sericytochromatia bacterium]|nr:MAG: hypothetical protein KatS3mg068_0430 [Candidatus Sericytochromatia bacterium]